MSTTTTSNVKDEQIVVGSLSLRDYFAAKASEEDIQEQKRSISECEVIRKDAFGSCYKSRGLPINWRQIARYMHADAMIAEMSKP